MGRRVEDQPVHALGEPVVGHLLERCRRLVAAAGECLRRHQRLAIDMGRRGRAANVLEIHQPRMQVPHPKLTHRDLHLALVEQGVLRHFERHAGRLRVEADAVGPQFLRHRAVVRVGPQIGQRPAKIPQETIAPVGIAHHASGQSRQPGRRVVAAPRAKLLRHPVSPVVRARLPAVHHHVTQALPIQRTERASQRVEVAVVVGFHVLPAELVGLPAGAGRRRGPVLRPGQRVTQPQHRPISRRHLPF